MIWLYLRSSKVYAEVVEPTGTSNPNAQTQTLVGEEEAEAETAAEEEVNDIFRENVSTVARLAIASMNAEKEKR